jgi:hypothetical protein
VPFSPLFVVLCCISAFTTFEILRDPKFNVLSKLAVSQWRQVRKFIINCILNTDMLYHFEMCRKINKAHIAELTEAKEDDRQFLCNIIIHSADLSGQVMPNSVARSWEERVSKEFDTQSGREEKEGLPVAPFMKNLNDMKVRGKCQIGFIDFVLSRT